MIPPSYPGGGGLSVHFQDVDSFPSIANRFRPIFLPTEYGTQAIFPESVFKKGIKLNGGVVSLTLSMYFLYFGVQGRI